MSWFRGAAAVVLFAAGGCLAPAGALAMGGTGIASAPAVIYDQQEFGNTVTDRGEGPGEPVSFHLDAGCYNGSSSWWVLPVVAGDQVTVDFEGGASTMLVFPVGTTDFNLHSTDSSLESDMASNDKQQATFSAPASGSMPIDFYDCGAPIWGQPTPGAYDFIAQVQHGLVVALTAASVNRRGHSTQFHVALHTPEGGPVMDPSLRGDVQRLTNGRWRPVTTLAPPFVFSDRWTPGQHGKWQSMRVRVHGPSYRTAISRTVRVRAA